jgi:hydroxymethylbilane synthase
VGAERIILGSRGSDLALAQARLVEQALRRAWPELDVTVEIIRTSGDEATKPAVIVDRNAGRKGLFTREIENELIVRRIDLAVHSAKDLPSQSEEELEIAGVLPRANTEDVLITKNGVGLTNLATGATIATGSIRRQRQLAWHRPDLQVVALRGNVPTRLRKLHENESWNGIVLARAGLERLGIEIVGQTLRLPTGQPKQSPYKAEILSADDFVSAGGQGIIALQVRRDDRRAQRLVEAVDDRVTHLCLRAEREFLRLLNGDCDSPVGAYARIEDAELTLRAQVFETDKSAPRVGTAAGATEDPERVAVKLVEQLYGR